jgi:hypothetical protein
MYDRDGGKVMGSIVSFPFFILVRLCALRAVSGDIHRIDVLWYGGSYLV